MEVHIQPTSLTRRFSDVPQSHMFKRQCPSPCDANELRIRKSAPNVPPVSAPCAPSAPSAQNARTPRRAAQVVTLVPPDWKSMRDSSEEQHDNVLEGQLSDVAPSRAPGVGRRVAQMVGAAPEDWFSIPAPTEEQDVSMEQSDAQEPEAPIVGRRVAQISEAPEEWKGILGPGQVPEKCALEMPTISLELPVGSAPTSQLPNTAKSPQGSLSARVSQVREYAEPLEDNVHSPYFRQMLCRRKRPADACHLSPQTPHSKPPSQGRAPSFTLPREQPTLKIISDPEAAPVVETSMYVVPDDPFIWSPRRVALNDKRRRLLLQQPKSEFKQKTSHGVVKKVRVTVCS